MRSPKKSRSRGTCCRFGPELENRHVIAAAMLYRQRTRPSGDRFAAASNVSPKLDRYFCSVLRSAIRRKLSPSGVPP